jgi:hypothetical protein
LGRFGISGKSQQTPIGTMSDGQKSRLVFAWLAEKKPHLLLFDEPTNVRDCARLTKHYSWCFLPPLFGAFLCLEGGQLAVVVWYSSHVPQSLP